MYRPSSLHNLDPHGDVLVPIELLFGLTNGQWYNTALQILNLIVCGYNVDASELFISIKNLELLGLTTYMTHKLEHYISRLI